jgi:predicted transcriptional regulator of viral defense system
VTTAALADRMATLLGARPRTFYELLRELDDVEYRAILQAWGALRERGVLGREPHGRYLIKTPEAGR